VPKLHNIIVYNSAINNIITLKPIKFQITSVLKPIKFQITSVLLVSSVSSVRFRYLSRYFGSCKLGTEHGTEYFGSLNFGSVLGKFGSVLCSRYFVPTLSPVVSARRGKNLKRRFSTKVLTVK
jgi:hypothetical protein